MSQAHTNSFTQAYDLADARPGTVVAFDGQLPSGFFASQKIVAVAPGKNAYTVLDDLAKEFKGADVVVSSSEVRGTHVIATFGKLGKPTADLS